MSRMEKIELALAMRRTGRVVLHVACMLHGHVKGHVRRHAAGILREFHWAAAH